MPNPGVIELHDGLAKRGGEGLTRDTHEATRLTPVLFQDAGDEKRIVLPNDLHLRSLD